MQFKKKCKKAQVFIEQGCADDLKVSHHVVLVGDSQNDQLKKENPDFRFYSLYPHVPLWKGHKNLGLRII